MKIKNNMKKLYVLSAVLLLFSCSKTKVFDKSVKFDNYDWNMDKVVSFDVAIEDTSATYNVYIPVRHTDNYPYDALLINVTYTSPNSEGHTKNYKLKFRDADGKFIGDGSGDIWDENPLIMEKAKFNEKGTYKFEIVNDMKTTPTQGIMELGLRIEKRK
jgi:gliding motility-associated lipoprotein GldH